MQTHWKTYMDALRERGIATGRPRDLERDCAWFVRFHVNGEADISIKRPHRGERPDGSVNHVIARLGERLDFPGAERKQLRRHAAPLECLHHDRSACTFPACFWRDAQCMETNTLTVLSPYSIT